MSRGMNTNQTQVPNWIPTCSA